MHGIPHRHRLFLSHIGAAVPVKRATVSRFDRLFASFGVRDNLVGGESYFLSEVRRMNELLEFAEAGERVFAVVDEPFTGTNVMDARQATELVCDGLGSCDNVVAFVASHLTDIADRLATSAVATVAHFGVEMIAGAPAFSFRLTEGVSSARMGMYLLAEEGVVARVNRLRDRSLAAPLPPSPGTA